jgi:hypothetical protein
MVEQRENMPLLYNVIAITEVSPPLFSSLDQNFVKVGKTGENRFCMEKSQDRI